MGKSDVFVKPLLKGVAGLLLTSGNNYTAIPVTGGLTSGIFNIRGLKSKTLTLIAAANDLLFRVELSSDGVNFGTRMTDILVTAGHFSDYWSELDPEIAGLWHSMRVSVKPNVGGAHGTGTFAFEGGTL